MNTPWILEGHLFLPPGRWQYGRIEIDGARVRSIESLEESGADRSAGTPEFARIPGAIPAWRLAGPLRLIPGFIDSHTHLMGVGLAPLKPDLSNASSKREALDRLAAWLRAHPGDSPVVGEGWDQSLWTDPTFPTRQELDRIEPSRPIAIRRVCGHVAVLNSAALERVGSDWSNVRREKGEAWEELPLALSRIWPPTEAERDEAVQIGQREAWKYGVTGIQEMGQRTTLTAYARAAEASRLGLRITHFLGIDGFDWLVEEGRGFRAPEDFLRLGGLKLFLDGSLGARSAALHRPYPGPDGGRGLLLYADERLREILRRAGQHAWQVVLHAIGDRAIEQAVAAVETLRCEGEIPAPPAPRIEHAEMLPPELLDRAVAAGFLFSMQPNFTARWQTPHALYERVLGAERWRALNPYHSVFRTGRLLFGSDTMPLGPWLGIRGATAHPDPEQRLSPEEALLAYTVGPAAAVSFPFHCGTLESGMPADLAAVRWPLPEDGPEAEEAVAATWVDGVLRYSRLDFAPPGA